LIAHHDHNTARFLRRPKGEMRASTEGLEPYLQADPMDSVLTCPMKRVVLDGDICALLNGGVYYCNMDDLRAWGRTNPKEWQEVSEQELKVWPVGRGP
jgi:hypothetical protein